MDYIFQLPSGDRHFMRAREDSNESRVHVALKMLGMLMMSSDGPRMEPPRGEHHRKYRPDVVSSNGRTWCEAGVVHARKLLEVGKRSCDRILVMKRGSQSAATLASQLQGKSHVSVEIRGWEAVELDRVAEAIRSRNDVWMERVDIGPMVWMDRWLDGADDRECHRLTMDGEIYMLGCLLYRVPPT